MNKPTLYLVVALLGMLVLLTGACAQPATIPSTATGTIEVRATDAPPSGVSNIEVTTSNIQVHKSDGTEGSWITVVKEERTFDLVSIQGAEIFLGSANVSTGNFTQIRLDVTKVTVTLNGNEIEAKLPSESLKVVRPWQVKEGEKTILTLDFEADKFVVLTGKDGAQVKPVIKLEVTKGERPLKTTDSKEIEEAALEDMVWLLESYGDPNNLNLILEDTKITIEFKSAEGRIEGSAGCNNYFVGYEINNNELMIIPPIGSTRMACPAPIMDQEQLYLSILETAGSVKVENDRLRVTSGDQVLSFKRQSLDDVEEALINTFDFGIDTEGWVGGFSDLPVNHEEHGYDVEFRYSDIPVEGEEGGGLLLTGNNHSDDLFMYAMRAFDSQDGLRPDTAYEIQLSFDLATNVALGMVGIGGSPGESVYIKAGVVNIKPKSEEDTTGGEEYYRINIDKGNQANGGEDMILLGNAAKGEGSGQNDESFQYKHFNYGFQAMTNENGELWVIIGADSGFEGISQLYLDNVSITFKMMTDAE